MPYPLPTVVLADAELNAGAAPILISLAVIAVGFFFILTPAQHLIMSDRKGRWLYEQEMRVSGDRKRAVAAAAFFYRLFGGVLVIFGVVVLALAWIPAPAN